MISSVSLVCKCSLLTLRLWSSLGAPRLLFAMAVSEWNSQSIHRGHFAIHRHANNSTGTYATFVSYLFWRMRCIYSGFR